MHETLQAAEDKNTSIQDLDGLLLARLWPPQRIVVGMRVSRWVREHLSKNAESVWISCLPHHDDAPISAKEVGRDLARLQHGSVVVDLGVYNCDYAHVNSVLCGVTKAWRFGWQGAVRSLDLSDSGVGTTEVEVLAKVLSRCTGLTSLTLAGNALRDDDIHPLSQALECCPRLQHVDLSYNRMRPAGAASLAGILTSCLQLQSIMLNNNRIGDSGAELLLGALSHCTALQYLSLKENGIGDGGARCLAEQLPRCGALLEVDMSCNRVGAEWALLLAGHKSGGGCLIHVHGQNAMDSGLGYEDEDEDEDDEDWCSEEEDDDDEECWGPSTPETRSRWRRSGGTWTRYSGKKSGGW